MALPDQAAIVIIGGGIIGCSTAYHLANAGASDVVLLERAQLTTGSTFHAAGLVGQLRSSRNVTELLKYSVELYDRLEEETGLATGWKRNGGLRLACSPERLIELQRSATMGRSFGLDIEILSPQQAQELWPLIDISDVVGAAFLPGDGQANPSDITQALARGARQAGVRIIEDCNVTGIDLHEGRISGVDTSEGYIGCEKVVNCAGQWARAVGEMAGVSVPLVSLQHQYIVTEQIDGVTGTLPTLRDPDRLVYFKEEVGGIVMGGYEPNPLHWAQSGIPADFNGRLLDEDWDHFEPLMTQAIQRMPALETVGVRTLINGPESFTPDGNFILGEAPEVAGFYVGAGFNAFGIAAGGGVGKALAEWVIADEQPVDLWPVDIRRFGGVHRDVEWVRTRTAEMYAKHYTMSWPHEEHISARPRLRSPLYEILKNKGACFGSKLGWERPNWFARAGAVAEDEYSFGRQNWFEAVGEEHQSCRERVVIFDQSSFAKFRVEGPKAEAALQMLCANDIAKPAGRLTYTQLLNDRGGIEADLTVSRLSEDSFYIVTGTGFRTRDYHWISTGIVRQGFTESEVRIDDATEELAVLSLMGPRARQVLEQVTNSDVSNEALPFASVTTMNIAEASVVALRVTYVGELGWELHINRAQAVAVYQALIAAGAEFGIIDAGYRAIESLRLEKGYRAWGSDVGPDHTPLEAGMAWAVKLDSDIEFTGREAIETQRAAGTRKRLACFTVDDPDVTLLGRETIFRDGEPVGWLSSGGWGYTVGKNIGLGYVRNKDRVDAEYLKAGSYELEVATERVPCTLQLGPLYDPEMAKIKR
ncbi:MAG: FAD-dependent oxidoreductase [Acidimicrobiales bacterium]